MKPDFTFLPSFVEVTPRLLTSAQPSPEHFALLRENGVEVVVNLAAPNATNFNPAEAELALENGLLYIHLPVIWTAPQVRDFETFTAILNAHQERVVLVHCALNMRVSAFVYAYQIKIQGEDVVTAGERMEKIWIPNEVWSALLQDIIGT